MLGRFLRLFVGLKSARRFGFFIHVALKQERGLFIGFKALDLLVKTFETVLCELDFFPVNQSERRLVVPCLRLAQSPVESVIELFRALDLSRNVQSKFTQNLILSICLLQSP